MLHKDDYDEVCEIFMLNSKRAPASEKRKAKAGRDRSRSDSGNTTEYDDEDVSEFSSEETKEGSGGGGGGGGGNSARLSNLERDIASLKEMMVTLSGKVDGVLSRVPTAPEL